MNMSDESSDSDEEEFLTLAYLQTLKPSRKSHRIDLDKYSDEDIVRQFRFKRQDLPTIAQKLGIPEEIRYKSAFINTGSELIAHKKFLFLLLCICGETMQGRSKGAKNMSRVLLFSAVYYAIQVYF